MLYTETQKKTVIRKRSSVSIMPDWVFSSFKRLTMHGRQARKRQSCTIVFPPFPPHRSLCFSFAACCTAFRSCVNVFDLNSPNCARHMLCRLLFDPLHQLHMSDVFDELNLRTLGKLSTLRASPCRSRPIEAPLDTNTQTLAHILACQNDNRMFWERTKSAASRLCDHDRDRDQLFFSLAFSSVYSFTHPLASGQMSTSFKA